MTKDQILSEALSLNPRERDEVAEALWQSIVPGELTDQQLAEVHRRIESLDAGKLHDYLYQRALESFCGSDKEKLAREVRRVVLHELAHHLGMSHDRMKEIGL